MKDIGSPRRRLVELDILRAVAILMVLVRHIEMVPENAPQFFNGLLRFGNKVGWAGVDLFFVLSGFLVSGLIFKEVRETGTCSIKRFLIRRGLRIYPAYYFFLLIMGGYVFLFKQGYEVKNFFGSLLLIQNYTGYLDYSTGHSWSLCVEEHFYLLLAYAFSFCGPAIIKRLRISTALYWMAGFGLLTVAVRSYFVYCLHIPTELIFPYSHLRLDSLGFGVFLGFLYWMHAAWLRDFVQRYETFILVFGMMCIGLVFMQSGMDSPFVLSIGFSLLYLGFGSILLWFILARSAWRPRLCKILAPIGRIGPYSYSIYLWHFPFSLWFGISAGTSGSLLSFTWQTLAYLTASLAAGICSTMFLEAKFLKLRERFFPTP